MKTIALMLLVCSARALSQADDYPAKFSARIAAGDDAVVVKMEERPFVESQHNLDEKNWLIDGKRPIGVDGYEVHPKTEIKSITVKWGSKMIELPRALFADCFSPDLKDLAKQGNITGDGVRVKTSTSEKYIIISMSSGRWASALYVAHWIVKNDGECDRFVIRGSS